MVAINPFSALSNVGQAGQDRDTIAGNFDTFMRLLTTQLQNQNPMDPLDMNQFTQQLVQFAEAEQTVKLNEGMEQMVQLTAANTINNAVGYIGKEVTTSGSSAQLRDGQASWALTLADDSPEATITVENENGNAVYTETGPLSEGTQVFNWDGRTNTGGFAPDGTYTLSVVAGDGSGGTVETTTATSGIVDGVDMSGEEPVLLSGGWEIRLQDIESIKDPASDDE